MTRYTVTWLQRALDQLAQLWIDYPLRRDAITAAAERIDAELAADPETKGVASTGVREMLVYPFSVLFSIRVADRIVEVADIHYIVFLSNGASS